MATPNLTVQYRAGGILALCVLHCWAECVPGVLPCIPDLQDNLCIAHLWVMYSTSGYDCHTVQKHASPWPPGLQVMVDLSETFLGWHRPHIWGTLSTGRICVHEHQPSQADIAQHVKQCKAKPHINDVVYGSGCLPAHEVQGLPNAGGAVADSWPGHFGNGAPGQLVRWICSIRTG